MPKCSAMVYHVYMMASASGVLYIGVTGHLESRTLQHKQKISEGFTSRYNVTKLVYFEAFGDIRNAIAREKQLKRWRREKKVALIEQMNPTWQDLSSNFHAQFGSLPRCHSGEIAVARLLHCQCHHTIVIPSEAGRRFFFRVRPCERVGLRSRGISLFRLPARGGGQAGPDAAVLSAVGARECWPQRNADGVCRRRERRGRGGGTKVRWPSNDARGRASGENL